MCPQPPTDLVFPFASGGAVARSPLELFPHLNALFAYDEVNVQMAAGVDASSLVELAPGVVAHFGQVVGWRVHYHDDI